MILRNKTQGNFTMISNSILRDRELCMKDRGVLCTLFSLPDSWEFSIQGLSKTVLDGYDSIANSIKRLEDIGYLKRNKIRDRDGKYRTELEVLCEKRDRLQFAGGQPKVNHRGFSMTVNPERLNRDGFPVMGNQGQYNTDNIKLNSKTEEEKSIIHSADKTDQASKSQNERMNDDSLAVMLSATKRRVEYERLTDTLKAEEIPYADFLIRVIAKNLSNPSGRLIKVAGVYIEGQAALSHLLNYSYDEVFAVAKNLGATGVGMDKPDSYYLTALDNQLRLNKPDVYAKLRYEERFSDFSE